METVPMIPADELERFQSCAHQAWDLAEQGQVEEGYEVLDLGLTWAGTPALNPFTGEESPPDPWSAQLISLYRHELVRYLLEYHSELGDRTLVRHSQLLRETASQLRETAQSICADSLGLKQRVEQLQQRRSSRPSKKSVH